MIEGQSGTGKSELALVLMGLGARLVADDQTECTRHADTVLARAPAPLRGLIEMRHMGLLRADPVDDVVLHAIVDMDTRARARMPAPQSRDILGVTLRLFHRIDTPAFAPALLHYMLQSDQSPVSP